MGNKLYVGNLPYRLSNEELESTFGEFGKVSSVKIITDRETGRSKGFGFIEMETPEEAQTCIDNLDGKELGGRNLKVNLAQERKKF